MVYEVRIFLKDGLLDPQATTIENALKRLQFSELNSVRLGRTFLLTVEPYTPLERIQEMCKQLLANPVMERYEIREVPS
ncbi:MAG: phosphoribosylformylglycinamidine synthase subunit PurS [bacterium]|nr:phosphoribosylformylglycinamidine synthase subunit PurS [bacterium]